MSHPTPSALPLLRPSPWQPPIPRLPALFAALLGAGLYALTLAGTFIYDDLYIAQADPRLHDIHRWKEFLTGGYFPLASDHLWRPLVSLSYAVQWHWHGATAWPYHLVNILLHAAACAVVAELARRLAGMRAAWIAGPLFAAHPVHVEAVAGIVGRAELLCTLAFVGALVLFLKRPLTIRRVLAITGCFLVALLSKEQGILLPLMLLMAALFVARPTRQERPALLWLAALVCWILAGYLLYRESILPFVLNRNFLDWALNPVLRCAGADRWLMPVVLLGHYAALLVAPLKLSPDYTGAVIGWAVRFNDPYLYVGFLAIAAWLAAWPWPCAAVRAGWCCVCRVWPSPTSW